VSKIGVSAILSTFALSIVVITLTRKGKINLNLKFLGIVKQAMDDGK
jgi:hypothetical protein